MVPAPASERPIDRLLTIMARLRDPETGCGWDQAQSFATIAPYTIEEAYEVADAIERGDLQSLKDELGDLLLQVVFHARMAEEQSLFSFDDVAGAICDKLVRRHPHIFAPSMSSEPGPDASGWDEIKRRERHAKALTGVLDDVPVGLPALTRAVKLSRRAASVGFVWSTTEAVLDKVKEELKELQAEIVAGDKAKTEEEFGDLLFVLANLGRDLDIDPERALRGANAKFERRFGFIEAELALEGRTPLESSLEEMDALWNRIRAADKTAP